MGRSKGRDAFHETKSVEKNIFAVLRSPQPLLAAGGAGLARSHTTDEGKRKVKIKVSPAYPELARRMSVSGKVKIEVESRPRRTHPGHGGSCLLLVEACQDAVKEWNFTPASEEGTSQIVEFEFRSLSN